MSHTLLKRIVILFLNTIPCSSLHAQCTSSGALSPGSAASISFSGSNFNFNNVNNIFSSDNNRATSTGLVTLFNGETEYLQATGFNFSIPPIAIICGIQVDVEKSATGIGTVFGVGLSYVTDYSVRLIRKGAIVGNNKASAAHWTGTESYYSYGGSSDIWGATWMPADVNAPDFGIAFSASIAGLAMLIPNVRIDHIRITVYYLVALLPKELFSFEAIVQENNTVSTEWKTGPEKNGARYALQRTRDGIQWETITGNLQQDFEGEMRSFKMKDINPYPGQSLYRLDITHANGEKIYSPTRVVSIKDAPEAKVYPNPFIDYLIISNIKPGDRIIITDANGRAIACPGRQINGRTRTLNLQSLKRGMYFISAANKTQKIYKH